MSNASKRTAKKGPGTDTFPLIQKTMAMQANAGSTPHPAAAAALSAKVLHEARASKEAVLTVKKAKKEAVLRLKGY